MTVNEIIKDTRVAHVRELKAEVARLKAELAAAQTACTAWEKHFAVALAAAHDAERLPANGTILILDGWNIVFNSKFKVPDDPHAGKQRLIDAMRTYSQSHASEFVWLVFDGAEENASVDGGLRISYTGGDGTQRADRLITDYVRLMRFTRQSAPMAVVTNDKAFGNGVRALGAEVKGVKEFTDGL